MNTDDDFTTYNSNHTIINKNKLLYNILDNDLLAVPKITQQKQITHTSFFNKNKNVKKNTAEQQEKSIKTNKNTTILNDIIYNTTKTNSYNDWFQLEPINNKKINKNNMAADIVNISCINTKQIDDNKQDNILLVNAWVKYRLIKNCIMPRNLGDDINFTFMKDITECDIKLYQHEYNKLNYLLIGSVLIDKFIDQHTIVWGTGMLKNKTLTKKPKKVYAVRGPKTRQVLLKTGIDCPEIYGDPALLMPYYYFPYVLKKYKLGIIPHHSHITSILLNNFKNNTDIKIINFVNYKDWKDVIKEMLSCEFIVSESLHGLIIADTYKIPNYYISFGNINQYFKYEDYFLSIGKTPYNPYIITSNTTYEQLLSLKNNYDNTFNIDLNKLVNACPIKLYHLNMTNNIKQYNGKVLLCCIAKMENLYIREFVDYYKNLGFDNICLYDNNDEDGEHFEDVINDYITSGFVILKNVRGKQLAQMPSYTECYNEYKNQYDWIAFFDIDEFLHFDNCKNIKQFLSNDMYNINGVNCIRVCWKQYDDSGIIKTNGDYSNKKYKTFLPITNIHACQTKPIIKTVLNNIEFTSAHGPIKDKRVKCVNTAGELCDNAITIKNITWKNACLNHYRFKTIEEFVLFKMIRLWPTHYLNGGKTGLNLNMFFQYNKKTKEKIEYAEYLIKKYNINRNEK